MLEDFQLVLHFRKYNLFYYRVCFLGGSIGCNVIPHVLRCWAGAIQKSKTKEGTNLLPDVPLLERKDRSSWRRIFLSPDTAMGNLGNGGPAPRHLPVRVVQATRICFDRSRNFGIKFDRNALVVVQRYFSFV